jgi:hypothetical protein
VPGTAATGSSSPRTDGAITYRSIVIIAIPL